MDQHQRIAKRKLLPIFTSRVLRELVTFGSSPRVNHARKALESISLIDHAVPVRDVFEWAYGVLRHAYPAEYVLLNECLCAHTSQERRFATFRELAVGSCKADLSVFGQDGHSRGYEIKSRFDSLSRLPTQLASYQRVFSLTYVVSDRIHIQKVLENSPDSVGVFSFSEGELRAIRGATEAPEQTNSTRLFALLQKNEYLRLIRTEFGFVPSRPNTEIYRACLELFRQIDSPRAQRLVTETLQQRHQRAVSADDPSWRLPRALRGLTLTSNLSRSDRLRLLHVMEQ